MIKVLHINPHFQLLNTYYESINKNLDFKGNLIFDYVLYKDTYVSFPNVDGQVFDIVNPFKNPLGYIKKVKEILGNNDYNIIHLHLNFLNFFGILAIKLSRGRPKIISHHHLNRKSNSLKSLIFRFFSKIIINLFSDVKLADSFRSGKEVYWNHFTILRPLIDYSIFRFDYSSRIKTRKFFKLPTKTILIGNVSNFIYGKNHFFLINLIKLLNTDSNINYKLMLFGQDYGTLHEIEQYIAKMDVLDQVIIESKFSVYDIYNSFDFFVFPSLFEGFGIVSLEAQVNGLPLLINEKLTDESIISKSTMQLSLDKMSDWVDYIKNFDLNYQRDDLFLNDRFDKKHSVFLYNLYKNLL